MLPRKVMRPHIVLLDAIWGSPVVATEVVIVTLSSASFPHFLSTRAAHGVINSENVLDGTFDNLIESVVSDEGVPEGCLR